MGQLLSKNHTSTAGQSEETSSRSLASIGHEKEPGEYERQQANNHYRKKIDAVKASKAAYSSGRHADAKKFSEESKEHQEEMERWNKKAVEKIFASHNEGNGIDRIDLHGLFVAEAVEKVEARILECKMRHVKELRIIVGKGIHSQDGEAKIKPKIQELLRKYQLHGEFDGRNTGCIVVDFEGEHKQGFFGSIGLVFSVVKRIFRKLTK